jgi:hypothetical protein
MPVYRIAAAPCALTPRPFGGASAERHVGAPASDVEKDFFHVAAPVALDQFARAALVHDDAGAQHDHVVAHSLHFAHVVRREQHRAAGAALVALEVRAHPVADVGIERSGGLVQQQHFGLVQHGLASDTRVRWPADRLPYGTLHEAAEVAVVDDCVDTLARAPQAVESANTARFSRR